MNRRILQLAIPSIVSNITVPLLGLVDVTIVGHLGSAAYIGAIAVGGLLFNILYWNFGFLRMGTSGLTSQAYGRKDADAEVKVLVQAVSVGLISAAAILILQYPVERLAFYLLDTSPEVEQYAVTYFRVCIWGAPAVLAMYGFKGWFIGMQNSRFPMFIAIAVNIINIVCSLCFVFVLGMKVEERPVKLAELSDFAECGVCGTAAVVCPVGKVVDHGREICFPSGMESMGPVIQKLYDTLTGIQMGKIEGPAGWVHKIM